MELYTPILRNTYKVIKRTLICRSTMNTKANTDNLNTCTSCGHGLRLVSGVDVTDGFEEEYKCDGCSGWGGYSYNYRTNGSEYSGVTRGVSVVTSGP